MTPTKRKAVQAFKKIRLRNAAIRGAKPERSEEYLKFIRKLPCVVCFMGECPHLEAYMGFAHACYVAVMCCSECCHVGKTGKGMRQKCSDYETIPMCHGCHLEQHGTNGSTFFDRHPIPLGEVFRCLREAYLQQHG